MVIFQTIQTIDVDVLLWMQNNLHRPILDVVLSFYTQLGNAGLLWIAIGIAMLFFKKTREAGVLALLSMLLGLLINNFTLKLLVSRDRPWVTVEGLIPLLYSTDPNSFPSGHTCAAFAFATSQCCCWKKRRIRISVLFAAVLMGFSRLYVEVHYPSDVLVGALVGSLCGGIVWHACKYWIKRRDLRQT